MNLESAAAVAGDVLARPDFLPPPVAPANEVETTLVAIWERLLNTAPVGIDDDFFQLNGDSFMAVALFTEIEEKWTRTIPPSSLVQSPTIRALAELIRDPKRDLEHPAIVVFNDAGTRPPFYLIHGRGGEVIFARPLAGVLDADQPLFALRYARGHETWPRPATVEGIAAAYADLLRTRHGDGPFRLAGYSLGAALALETAQQITRQGGVVERLIMIDPPIAPQTRENRLKRHMRDLGRHSPGKAAALLADRIWIYLSRIVRDLFSRLPGYRQRTTGRVADRATHGQRLELTKAFKMYRPKPYRDPVTIVSAEDSRRVYDDPTMGWKELISGPIETIELSGSHDTIIREPLIHELAARIAGCIDAKSGS